MDPRFLVGAGLALSLGVSLAGACHGGVRTSNSDAGSSSSASSSSASGATGSAGSGGAGGSGGGVCCPPLDAGACPGHAYYAGKLDGAGSVWSELPQAMNAVGLEAGDNACKSLAVGADHVCDYEEVLLAEAQGELASIPAGTTAWVQRTTTAIVNGAPSEPGRGGNCNNWTFGGNHLADGEYATFDTTGVPTFHLDDDTIFDPNAPLGEHIIAADLQCGSTVRSILCCYPLCP